MFKGIYLYTGGVLFHVQWCIRQLCCLLLPYPTITIHYHSYLLSSLQAQREALRRRFDPDSEDMQGDAFEFQFKSDITSPSSARQELESALQGSTAVSDGKASRHPPVDLVKIANDTART